MKLKKLQVKKLIELNPNGYKRTIKSDRDVIRVAVTGFPHKFLSGKRAKIPQNCRLELAPHCHAVFIRQRVITKLLFSDHCHAIMVESSNI